MAERGARIASLLTNLSFGAVGAVAAAILVLPAYSALNASEHLWMLLLILASLAPVLALSGVVAGLAAGIGFPMRSAVALILGIVAAFWPALHFLLWSNCQQHYC